MQKVCRNCCRIFCPQRNTVSECNKQITFVTQMIQEMNDNFYTSRLQKQTRTEVKETKERSLKDGN